MNITIEEIAKVAGIVTVLITFKEVAAKYLFGTNKEKIKANTKSVYELKSENECRKREIKDINETLTEIQTTTEITLESLLALINHEIDGNGKDAMKSVRNKLQNQLIKK